jgi:carboxyl-terminal processing protease
VEDRREVVLEPTEWTLRPANAEEIDEVTVVQIEALSEDAVDVVSELVPEEGPVILDLRELRWGLELEAINLADSFVRSGRLGGWQGRRAGSKTYEASEGAVTEALPLVLVSPATEGVGEILAAALQGAGALIVGQRTLGHAPYMSLVRDGDVAVWMPVGQWLRSDDEAIDGNGIEPDEVIEIGPDQDGDPVLDRALELLSQELEEAA